MGTKPPAQATGPTLSQQVPQVTEPTTMIDLTRTAHPHVPTNLCPTFALYEPGHLFSSLGTVFDMSVRCLPGVGLTEINSFPMSPPLISLP